MRSCILLQFMNSSKITAVMLILVIAAAVLYETSKYRELETSLAALNKERDDLGRQVKNLTRVVADLKDRVATAPAPVVAAPRAEPAAPPPAPARLVPVATPGVSITAPAGWGKNGSKPNSYVVGVDATESLNGLPSAYVKSLEPVDGFGGMMQTSLADEYLGKRIRMSGWAKTNDANDGGGHLWLRVDGQRQGQSLQFDNMDSRPILGSTGWQQYSVVLDVPSDARALAYGFFVHGAGQMWVNNTKIEVVGADVPTTNMIRPPPAQPKSPANLNFVDPGTPPKT